MTQQAQARSLQPDSPLAAKAQTCLNEPFNADLWEDLEIDGDHEQLQSEVALVYRTALAQAPHGAEFEELAQRATRYHEEWQAEDRETVIAAFSTVLEREPDADWAFERLTLYLGNLQAWSEVLAAYDARLRQIDAPDKRQVLLEEAAQVARDFAQAPELACRYLIELLRLSPRDDALYSTVERLIERHGNADDSQEVLRIRIHANEGAASRPYRLALAKDLHGRVGDAMGALAQLDAILGASPGDRESCDFLLSILKNAELTLSLREHALTMAREHLTRAGREDDLIEILLAQLDHFAANQTQERAAAHRELAQRFEAKGDRQRALAQFLAGMSCEPEHETLRAKAKSLAIELQRVPDFIAALNTSAQAAAHPGPRTQIRLEIVSLYRDLPDSDESICAMLKAIASDPAAGQEHRLSSWRELAAIYEARGENSPRLEALRQLAIAESNAAHRREIWMQVAQISTEIGEIDDALNAWSKILEIDPNDEEAHASAIAILEANGRWEALAERLEARAESASSAEQAKKDLLRAGQVREGKLGQEHQALNCLLRIDTMAVDTQVLVAVDRICARLGQWEQFAAWLEPQAARHDPGAVPLIGRLAQVLADHLDRANDAATHYAHCIELAPAQRQWIEKASALVLDPRCTFKRKLADTVLGAWAALGDAQAELEAWRAFRPIVSDREWQRKAAARTAELARLQGASTQDILESWLDALELDPLDLRAEEEVLSLVFDHGPRAAVAERLGAIALALPQSSPRRSQLLATKARLLHGQGDHNSQAAQAWYDAATEAPDRSDWLASALRSAMDGGHWSIAAQSILELERRGLPPERVMDSIDVVVQSRGEWPQFLEHMAHALHEAASTLGASARAHWHLTLATWSKRAQQPIEFTLQQAQAALALVSHHERREVLELLEDVLIAKGNSFGELLEISSELAAHSLPTRGRAIILAKAALASGDEQRSLQALRDAIELELAHASQDAGATESGDLTWAIEAAMTIYEKRLAFAPAYECLNRVAQRTSDTHARAKWLMRAADYALARNDLQGSTWALQQANLAQPGDREIHARLSQLLTRQERWLELSALQQSELNYAQTLGLSVETQIELRLAISASFARLGDVQSRVELLAKNLELRPGHVATLRAMIDLFRQSGSTEKIVALLESQADSLGGEVHANDRSEVAEILRLAGDCARRDLKDPERAIAAYTRAAELLPDRHSIAALADLYQEQRQPEKAAQWLEALLPHADERDKLSILYRSARCHAQAGRWSRAAEMLKEAWPLRQGGQEIGRLYVQALEHVQAWPDLIALLCDQGRNESDPRTLTALALRAYALGNERLHAPRLALELLERAMKRADAPELLQPLARALGDAGRLPEAQAILQELIEGMGRKRSPERAALHLELAGILQANQELDEALKELETAATMDPTRTAILVQIAELAQTLNYYPRAEKALRSLLWLVKKQEGDAAANAPKAAWIQFRLAKLAQAQGNEDQAATLWDSCLESAAKHDDQAQALQNVLREAGETKRLIEVIENRLKGTLAPTKEAALWAELAQLVSTSQGEEGGDKALKAAFAALSADPAMPTYHEVAKSLALRAGAPERYRAHLLEMVQSSRAFDDSARAQLYLRLAREHADASEANAAWQALDRAGELGSAASDLARAGVAIATQIGDALRQREYLDRLDELGLGDEASRFESMCALAAIHLAREEESDAALAALEAAAEQEPDWPAILALIHNAHPHHRASPLIHPFWEQAARASGDPLEVLTAIVAATASPNCPEEKIEEAAEIAKAHGRSDQARELYARAIDNAIDPDGDAYLWARFGLFDLAMQVDDYASAAAQIESAANASDLAPVIERALHLHERATQAEQSHLVVRAFERLFEADAYNEAVWRELSNIYVGQRDADKLEALLDRCLSGIESLSERNRLRLALIDLLGFDEVNAQKVQDLLNDVLLEDPNDEGARDRLLEIAKQSGDLASFERLLDESLEIARERGDEGAIVHASLLLAAHARTSGDAARAQELTLQAYELAPHNTEVRLAMLEELNAQGDEAENDSEKIVQGDGDEFAKSDGDEFAKSDGDEFAKSDGKALAKQRLSILSSLVNDGPLDSVGAWAQQASQLAVQCGARQDATRILNRALERLPTDSTLLRAFGDLCQEPQEINLYIERLVLQAQSLDEPKSRSALYAHASTLAQESFADYARAAQFIELAIADDPTNVAYWHSRIENLAQDQNLRAAAESCILALQALSGTISAEVEAEFFAAASEIAHASDDEAGLLSNLEEAYQRDATYADRLRERWQDALGHARSAQHLGDERKALVRLLELNADQGQSMLPELKSFLERSEDDFEIAQRVLQLALDAQDTESLQIAARTLMAHEGEEMSLLATEHFVHACESLGQLDDAARAVEWVFERWPNHPRLRSLHRKLVAARGDHAGLAAILMSDAQSSSDIQARVGYLREAAEQFLLAQAPDQAFSALLRAHEELPLDVAAAMTLVDAYIDVERYQDAETIADRCLAAYEEIRQRPPEISPMQHRKAWLRQAQDDHVGLLAWLNEAYQTDKNNFDAAIALAEAAQAAGEWEAASRVLRNLSTLEEDQCPISRVELFARQARLWQAAGDLRKASFWAHKTKHLAPNDPMALELLAELTAANRTQSGS